MATTPRSQAPGSVSDTALLVACHRAMETRRPDARLRDQFAVTLSEGLLVYLDPRVVGELADDLHAVPGFRHWIIDLATPMIRKRVNRWWGKKLQQANTRYQFAPEEGTRFFDPHGWREAEFQPLWDHAVRLDRMMPGAWTFKLMSRLMPRRTARQLEKWRAGVVLLGRETRPGRISKSAT